MLTNFRGVRRCVLGCAAVLFALAPAAQAAAPEPCDGTLLVKDVAGDQVYKVNGNPAPPEFPAKPPANTDTTGLFFRSDEGKLTANIVISDLTKTLPQGFQAVRYRVYVTVGGAVRYLQALLTADGVEYSYGSQMVLPVYSFYYYDDDTKGAFHEGKNGVVQIEIPADIAKAGTKMDAIAASIGMLTAGAMPEEGQTAGSYWAVDSAPDASTSTVKTDAPADCPPVVEAPAAETPAPVVQAPPVPAQIAAAPLGAPFQANGDLRIAVAKTKLSSRKVKRRLRMSLRTSERLTFVTIRLERGGDELGRLDLAELGGRKTLTMKLRRRLARRAHTLVVSGTRADGTMATKRLRLEVKR